MIAFPEHLWKLKNGSSITFTGPPEPKIESVELPHPFTMDDIYKACSEVVDHPPAIWWKDELIIFDEAEEDNDE